MPTPEEEASQRIELQKSLASLLSIEPGTLVRADVLGSDLSFAPGLPIFRRTLDLFRQLSEVNLDDIPYEVLNNLNALTKQALSHFQQVQNFKTNQANPGQVRDSLIVTIRDQWHNYYSAITPVLAYNAQRGTDFDKWAREARGARAEQQQILTEMRTEAEKVISEARSALDHVQRAAAQIGVSQHAVHFKEEAERHSKQSWFWLGAAVLFAGVAAAYAIYSLEFQLKQIALNVTTGRLIQLALARVVIISILTYAMVFSARQFAAARHNFVINRHRQNALSSFETFVQAAGDPQTKDAVLIQATQSIFAPQMSGYMQGDKETSSQGGQIIEVVRSLTGAKD